MNPALEWSVIWNLAGFFNPLQALIGLLVVKKGTDTCSSVFLIL